MHVEPPSAMALSGPMTLRTIDATHRRLVEALREARSLELDVDEVDEVDLSFIQLVEAARAAAARAGKSFRLKRAAEGALLATLQRGGFLAEHSVDERTAFWLRH